MTGQGLPESAGSHGPRALRAIAREIGQGQLVYGTDTPAVPGQPLDQRAPHDPLARTTHGACSAFLGGGMGAVREERLVLRDAPVSNVHREGELVTVPAGDIDRVAHAAGSPAITIHAYSPPLGQVGTYLVDNDGRLRRLSTSPEHSPRRRAGDGAPPAWKQVATYSPNDPSPPRRQGSRGCSTVSNLRVREPSVTASGSAGRLAP